MQPQKETLFDASTTIYNQIAKLRRGLPIAEAKAATGRDRLKIRKDYNKRIGELRKQYQAVWAAMEAIGNATT